MPDQATQVSPLFTCVCPLVTHMLVVWVPLLTLMCVTQFIVRTFPKVAFKTVTTFLFLIGESMSCFLSKARDDDPEAHVEQCDDVVYSNATLMRWVTMFACAQLVIFPFMTSNYTMRNLPRFDCEFREQAQIMFACSALGMAIFMFASGQDGGYSDGGFSSKRARGILDWSKCARLHTLTHLVC